MRCSKYNIGNKLPKYLRKDGKIIPCVSKNFEMLGVLVRIDAVPETGKIITISHGEIIAGKWTEIIDEQKTQEQIDIDSLTDCTKLELYEAMNPDMIEVFNAFKALPEFELTNDFDFTHSTIESEIVKLEPSVLYEIKKRIVENRIN